MLPYWYDAVVPDLGHDRTVLIVAHGNSLRALVKHLDGIQRAYRHRGAEHPDRDPAPSTSSTTRSGPVTPGGTYLDPDAAPGRNEAVGNQGR